MFYTNASNSIPPTQDLNVFLIFNNYFFISTRFYIFLKKKKKKKKKKRKEEKQWFNIIKQNYWNLLIYNSKTQKSKN